MQIACVKCQDGRAMNILVTGGCGFIGSHFVEYVLNNYPHARVINLDALTYAAHPDTRTRLLAIAPDRYGFVHCDISSPEIEPALKSFEFDSVVNFAAETHVDRSILNPASFVRTNVAGVENLLRWARNRGKDKIRFVHVSTDEVYGSLKPQDLPFSESSPLSPNSPYAASKAGADLLAMACYQTYGQPVLITRCSNNFGPYQFPEKLLPLVIANALEGKPIPVYGDGKQSGIGFMSKTIVRLLRLFLKRADRAKCTILVRPARRLISILSRKSFLCFAPQQH